MLQSDDKLLISRVNDQIRLCEARCRPCFTPFLDERQAVLAESAASKSGAVFDMFGGYEGATRRVLGIFPYETERSAFPITHLFCEYSAARTLSHRDVLGTLTANGVGREYIGDIFTDEHRLDIFVLTPQRDFICGSIDKIGSASVKLCVGGDFTPPPPEYDEIRGTVASERLDCVVAFVTGGSRERAAEAVRSGTVTLRYETVKNVSAAVCEGDILSIRGRGKYKIKKIGPQTRKGRLTLCVLKYK